MAVSIFVENIETFLFSLGNMPNRSESGSTQSRNRGTNWTDALEESLAMFIKKHWQRLGFTDNTVRSATHRQEQYAVGT